MSDATTQPPADVRGRIIRASILPIEDEETMIASLRSGAEGIERGELDVDDFVGVWSQYLRQLLRASSVPAPADVRERVAKEVYVCEHVRRGAEESWARQRWQTETDGVRDLYFEAADRILALIRTPRGEGEDTIPVSALRSEIAQLRAHRLLPYLAWARLCALAGGEPVGEDTPAARRSKAQGEEDVGEVCDLCGEEFDPSEPGTVTGPLGQDDGLPRWYRCPRCARAYDAGYQQGQRDPRGDETADPTALRSDAEGEDWWEDLVFRPIVEAYNARRGEGEGDTL